MEHTTANAAVARLVEVAEAPDLDPGSRSRIWRQLCAVARAHRPDRLPEVNAAAAVAVNGPQGCLATVALTAFRQGPEDADDRMTSLAALGRFSDPRVAGWLLGVVQTGAASHEALAALAQWIPRADAQWLRGHGEGLRSVIEGNLAPLEPAHVSDEWQRWAGLQALAALIGRDALAHVVGAWQAVGMDDAPWYPRYLASLAAALAGQPAIANGDLAMARASLRLAGQQATDLPTLPGRETRLLARCPRVARQAAAELQAAPSATATAALLRRAAVETALVARGQLIASLLPAVPAEAPEDPEVAAALAASPPWCHLMSDVERAELAAQERDWIEG